MDALLTLDYELFLGFKTGSVDACILQPMERLLKIADKHGIKMVVFVDAAYLLRLKQLSTKNTYAEDCYNKVVENIQLLDKNGHDVEMHFHPQWLYSNIQGESWEMDFEHYKLSDVPKVDEAFLEAKKLLDSLLEEPCIAFRAGGYSLETYTDFPTLFKHAGIICDSSVLRGHQSFTKYQYYDYSVTPSKHLYRFENSLCREQSDGSFLEASISGIEMNGLLYLLYRLYCKVYLRNDRKYGDGKPIGGGKMSIFKKRKISASIDYFTAPLLGRVYKKCKGQDAFVLIGHPKNASPKSLKRLDSFLGKYSSKLEFKTLREIL